MKSVSTRLEDETYRLIAETADERDVSKAEVLRELVEKGMQYDDLKQENERLQRQLAATNRRVGQHQELVEYVREERDLQQRREERLDAPVWRRTKWWLLGRDRD